MFPQALLKQLAEAQGEVEVEIILRHFLIDKAFDSIEQFNKNTGILLHDFRGVLANIGARYE